MDEKKEEQIINKLDTLIRLTAYNAIKGESLEKKIWILSSIGLRNIEIAEILDKSPKNIGVRLSRIRKKKGKIEEQESGEIQNKNSNGIENNKFK